MREWVEKLLDLQDKDLRIKRLQEQVDSVPAEKERAQNESRAAEERSAQAKQALQTVQMAIKDVEIKIDATQTKMREFQSKTTMIKNNEEYRAALTHIEHSRADVAKLEDQELILMEELERARERLNRENKALEIAKDRVNELVKDLETRAGNCGAQIEKLKTLRDQAAVHVPANMLSLYDRIRKSKKRQNGLPVFVPLRDGFCENCHMKATAQVKMNVVKGLSVACEYCGTLLYSED